MESDTRANIESDHYPVWLTVEYKFKKPTRGSQAARTRYDPIDERQKEAYTEDLIKALRRPQQQPGYKQLCEILHQVVPKHFRKRASNKRDTDWSEVTERLFYERKEARASQEWEKPAKTDKAFRKSLNKDKTRHLLQTFQEDLDLRSKWMGIRALKTGYKPAPYHRTNQGGQHIPLHQRAEEAAP